MLLYKEFTGTMEYSKHMQKYYGKVVGISDLVLYEAKTQEELPDAFREAVDAYLAKKDGKDRGGG